MIPFAVITKLHLYSFHLLNYYQMLTVAYFEVTFSNTYLAVTVPPQIIVKMFRVI